MLAFDAFLIWKKISHSVRRSIVGKRKLHDQNYNFAVDALPKELPRIVWIFWDKPLISAPAFIKYAVQSWIDKNPGWEVRVIDNITLPTWVDIPNPFDQRKVQGRSDAIRLALLTEYGGVWVDASCACVVPLDHWLPSLMQSGFFAFPDTYPGREVQSWFLAASPDNHLTRKWCELALRYYGRDGKLGHYFWVMHLFEYLIRTDRRAANIWAMTPKVSGKGPALLKRVITQKRLAQEIPATVNLSAIPMLKISSGTRTDDPEIQSAIVEHRDIDIRKMVEPLLTHRRS